MKQLISAFRIYLLLTLLLGLAYPLLMTGLSQTFFSFEANGSLALYREKAAGSFLIAQKFERPEFFWPRPSAVNYSPLPSGGSNAGPISQNLRQQIEERRSFLKAAHALSSGEPPSDLLFASASGLDPHISLAAAEYQAARVAAARQWPLSKVQDLIKRSSRGRSLGLFGEPTVNVLALNIGLEEAAK